MTANTWTAADIPSQLGKLAIVTGATSGPGYQPRWHLLELALQSCSPPAIPLGRIAQWP
jgi:hypothetical protein